MSATDFTPLNPQLNPNVNIVTSEIPTTLSQEELGCWCYTYGQKYPTMTGNYTHLHVQSYTYTVYTYIHTCTYIHTYIHTYSRYIHTYIRTYIHTYIHVHTYIHTYIHTYVHTYIHTYMYIYIHTGLYVFLFLIGVLVPLGMLGLGK